MSERYTLTQPKTRSGEETEYFWFLNAMNDGMTYTGKYVRFEIMRHMTFQALRDKGLIEYKNKEYNITPNGKMYVGVVNSSNQYSKEVLKTILNQPKAR